MIMEFVTMVKSSESFSITLDHLFDNIISDQQRNRKCNSEIPES